MTMKTRVAILYGGPSAEHEISVISARGVLSAIDRDKYDPIPIAVTKNGRWLLPNRPPDQLDIPPGTLPSVEESDGALVTICRDETGRPILHAPGSVPPRSPITPETSAPLAEVDVVFPLLHGPGGEDGTIQGLLDAVGVPYVGAGVAASAVGMDKSLQKPVFAAAGIPVTPWVSIHAPTFFADPDTTLTAATEQIGFPCFTKPATLGSSVGVSKCRTPQDLRHGLETAFAHAHVALVEHAVPARELECAILGNDQPQASIVGEIVPSNEFYDYEAKYVSDASTLIIPAGIPDQTAQTIRLHALRAFQSINCTGMARVDFFLRTDLDPTAPDAIYCNEINTIPGFTPISMYPKLWEASGIPYPKLVDHLIELALERTRTQ